MPRWLSERMARLGRVIVEALYVHYGPEEVLRRIVHPFWFQSFGAVMSGEAGEPPDPVEVLQSLKQGLDPVAAELGIFLCGGGPVRKTPPVVRKLADKVGVDGHGLARASRLVGQVDDAAIQDGYSIGAQFFAFTAGGEWAAVESGTDRRGLARTYHWSSVALESFVDAPHTAIQGPCTAGHIIDLTNPRAAAARAAAVAAAGLGPQAALEVVRHARRGQVPGWLPDLVLPHQGEPVDEGRFRSEMAAVEAAAPRDFEALLLVEGLGPRTLEALALVAEVVEGHPVRFADPAERAAAGPSPVPADQQAETLQVLRSALGAAKLGHDDRRAALRELDHQAQALERAVALRLAEPPSEPAAARPRRPRRPVAEHPRLPGL